MFNIQFVFTGRTVQILKVKYVVQLKQTTKNNSFPA